MKSNHYSDRHKQEFEKGRLYNAQVVDNRVKITDDLGNTNSFSFIYVYQYFVDAAEYRKEQIDKIL
jgi:hypothetical protein